ncbi:hypothetical protein ABZ876_13480 [Streptomyces sp. NPDC046931]|uniref:aromatic-ring hydroxylase C-terminal domain-containing protein n=1 Tax=Streptomyces sp. NPDC046931 TaxID=3154806 RepID=UPI0033F0A4CE
MLDSYHAERHPVGAQVLHHTSAQRVLADPNPSGDVAALCDIFIDLLRLPDAYRHLAGLMSGLSLRYELPGEHPQTGQRMPDADLVTEAGPIRLSALFGSGHALLLDLAGSVPADPRPPHHESTSSVPSAPTNGALPPCSSVPNGYVCRAADSSAAYGDTLLAAIAGNLARVR